MKNYWIILKKIIYVFSCLSLLLNPTLYSQVNLSGEWAEIGDTNLSIITDDAHNGDGVGDGAIFVDGQSVVVGQGVAYTFDGTMTLSESISLNTYTYNVNVAYGRCDVELYNLTDNILLSICNSKKFRQSH